MIETLTLVTKMRFRNYIGTKLRIKKLNNFFYFYTSQKIVPFLLLSPVFGVDLTWCSVWTVQIKTNNELDKGSGAHTQPKLKPIKSCSTHSCYFCSFSPAPHVRHSNLCAIMCDLTKPTLLLAQCLRDHLKPWRVIVSV